MEKPPRVFVPRTRDEFEDRVGRYPLGLVINRKFSNDAMIRFGKCGRFKHGDRSASLTKNLKACSRSRRALEDWWLREDGTQPKRCRSCGT
ncbi:MAG: hypothetical protein M3P49_09725 [Actinomycetota bacterium]|nr:hypothetical protein [Actinomycetota bacterium]